MCYTSEIQVLHPALTSAGGLWGPWLSLGLGLERMGHCLPAFWGAWGTFPRSWLTVSQFQVWDNVVKELSRSSSLHSSLGLDSPDHLSDAQRFVSQAMTRLPNMLSGGLGNRVSFPASTKQSLCQVVWFLMSMFFPFYLQFFKLHTSFANEKMDRMNV